MRRSLDWVIDRYLSVPPPTKLRSSLRAGAYQILYMRVPNHAAVSATVSASSKKIKVLSMQYFVVYLKNCK